MQTGNLNTSSMFLRPLEDFKMKLQNQKQLQNIAKVQSSRTDENKDFEVVFDFATSFKNEHARQLRRCV